MHGFLRGDRATPALLAVAVIGLFILTPLADMKVIHSRLPEYAFWLFMVLGVALMTYHPLVRSLEIVFACGALAADLINFTVVETSCTLLYILVLIWVLWQRVFARGRVTANRLMGAVTVYILLGVLWNQIYDLLEAVHPGSFNFGPDFSGISIDSSLMYFSFITLTTVGYGDATPAMPFAHSMAVLEALVGQLYLAILIGRLVSNMQAPSVGE
jgi:hypothetical protein